MFKPYTRAQVDFESRKDIGAEGKNSTTHLCFDPQLNAQVVVKKVLKADLEEDLYFEESQHLYRSSHPNVVPVLYACQDDDSVYIAMPFFERGSVKALVEEQFLTVREIVTLSCQTLTGLHNVHSKGLVHFDVKLDNILLSDRGEALLSDFGLAKAMAASGRAAQDRFYFKNKPPEALAGGYEFDIRFDIYQLACLSTECATETKNSIASSKAMSAITRNSTGTVSFLTFGTAASPTGPHFSITSRNDFAGPARGALSLILKIAFSQPSKSQTSLPKSRRSISIGAMQLTTVARSGKRT